MFCLHPYSIPISNISNIELILQHILYSIFRERPYDSEDVLQELLARYPNLLAGEQIDADVPRRWLLITREAGVPSEDIEGRWSTDHQFLDQDAILTLVEEIKKQ